MSFTTHFAHRGARARIADPVAESDEIARRR